MDSILSRVGASTNPGAFHIGNHSLFWAIERRARVLAFEPNPSAREILVRNVARNRVESSTEIRGEALAAVTGRGALIVPAGNLGAARVTESGEGDVDVISLDSLELADVTFIKVDVEGAELAVLGGASRTIIRCKPTIWVELLDRTSRDSVQRLLSEFGYFRRPIWLGATNALFLPSILHARPILTDPIAMRILARRQMGRLGRYIRALA
jgi:FkbM family methyltransferase